MLVYLRTCNKYETTQTTVGPAISETDLLLLLYEVGGLFDGEKMQMALDSHLITLENTA